MRLREAFIPASAVKAEPHWSEQDSLSMKLTESRSCSENGMDIALVGAKAGEAFVLRLFVAGNEPHSSLARANLDKICARYLAGNCHLEIVDVFESYALALADNIFVTPALVKLAPEPRVTIFGDLRDTQGVLAALGLTGAS